MSPSIPLLASLVSLLAAPSDWPQYNGPGSDRSAAGAPVAFEGAPQVAWRARTSPGFSSFAVADGRAFTIVRREGREACLALDAGSGEELWCSALSEPEYDGGGDAGARGNEGGDGPRSTPSVDGERVFCFDAGLVLWCLDAKSGRHVWKRDLIAEHDGREVRWQNASSPLVEGELVLVAGGGAGQSLLAFDKRTGRLAWKTGDETMTHATPVAATIHGVRQAIFFLRSGLVSVAPESGEELWRIPYDFSTSSAASPVVHGDVVYCSAGYGVGAGAFRITKDDAGFGHELVWRKRNKLMNHWSTPVAKDGHLYGLFGFKDYGEAPLACVELATGEIRWSREGYGPGNVILVGDTLVALSDAGEVVLVDAKPAEYVERARADVLEGKCWSSPAWADGALYVRSTEEAARLDLGAAR